MDADAIARAKRKLDKPLIPVERLTMRGWVCAVCLKPGHAGLECPLITAPVAGVTLPGAAGDSYILPMLGE